MLVCKGLLIILALLQIEVESKAIESDRNPKPLKERIKLRKLANKFESRFSEDEIVIDDKTKPEKGKLKEDGGVLPFSFESRFSFDGEDNSDKNDESLEYGEFYQGDIELMPDQEEVFKSNDTDEKLAIRTGQLQEYYRWPKNRQGYVIVPYYFHQGSHFSTSEVYKVRAAIKHIERYTCIRFVEGGHGDDYVLIYSGNGCSSNLGRNGGQQELSLEKSGCFKHGTIVHELIHSLGFDHMQNHADRDRYVDIKWNNIKPNVASNFEKVNKRLTSSFNTGYDYYSVMHYQNNAFAKNKKYYTIYAKDERYRSSIGQRDGMSHGDAIRLNRMYSCFD